LMPHLLIQNFWHPLGNQNCMRGPTQTALVQLAPQ
jgi:hypothetical protein